jgi:hypothetical protein
MLASLGPGPPALPVPGALPPPPRLSTLCLAYQGFGNPVSALTGLRPWWAGSPLVPAGLCPLQAATVSCFAIRACPQWHFPLGLPLLLWTRLGLYHLRLDHPGLRRIWIAPEGFCTHGARPFSGTKPSSGHPQVIPLMPTPNHDYLTPGASPPRPFLRMLGTFGSGPQRLLRQGLCPTATSPLP